MFGMFGTLISFAVMVLGTWILNISGKKIFFYIQILGLIIAHGSVIVFSMSEILLYSACVCATDSVAALTMIKPDKYPKLFSILFGEGMVNDSVSIILYMSV